MSLPRWGLYYGGAWHAPHGGQADTWDPATGTCLAAVADADAVDVDRAVAAAREGFAAWRRVRPLERAALLRRLAALLRAHGPELAHLDALNAGNPVREMTRDVEAAAVAIEYAAGLVTEVKGETVPMGEGVVNLSLREPYGVVARLVAYNHPLMFVAGKAAPALAVGNAVIMKPPEQAPLSALRLMELWHGVLPPGVLNLVTAGATGSAALVAHPDVPRLSLIGSVATGRAVARSAADRLKHVTLELGGKNACIVYPDADLEAAGRAAVAGMNFAWCGQSCGSTSRLFLHDAVYDRVLADVLQRVRQFRPGLPTDPATTMGALVSPAQRDKVLSYIEIARAEGAQLLTGGWVPDDPALARGCFVEPTVFGGVTQDMRIAREEVFGPVLAVLRWRDEAEMLAQVNAVDYGLTASIWTRSLSSAHRAAAAVQAGFVWVNHIGAHFTGASFGGYKQSGLGREEGLEELYSYTQHKNVHIVI